jgi:hypothetical protein
VYIVNLLPYKGLAAVRSRRAALAAIAVRLEFAAVTVIAGAQQHLRAAVYFQSPAAVLARIRSAPRCITCFFHVSEVSFTLFSIRGIRVSLVVLLFLHCYAAAIPNSKQQLAILKAMRQRKRRESENLFDNQPGCRTSSIIG